MTEVQGEIPVMEGWITISLAAQILDVSRQTAHAMAKDGRLGSRRVRSAGPEPVLVREKDVQRMAAEMAQSVVEVGAA